MEVENADDNEVTLVLLGESGEPIFRVKAQKDKLARHSEYFKKSFSGNFCDHARREFEVGYMILPITLQAFVDWCCNDGEYGETVHSSEYHFDVRISLQRYLTEDLSELLQLLEFGTIFAAEKLIEDLSEMLICRRLHPEKMLEIWQFAEAVKIKVLRDVAFSVCLDRFEELSLPTLLSLSEDVFFKLVNNMNIRSSSAHIASVIKAWMMTNRPEECIPENPPDAPNDPDNYEKRLRIDFWYNKVKETKTLVDLNQFKTSSKACLESVYETIRPQFMACAAGRQVDSLFFWAWNDNKREIEELAEITDAKMRTRIISNGKDFVGRQTVGRGFSIYVIGGEQGIGTGRFNETVWRYCLISKKWYIETIMPRRRRHMAVAFLKNKLYLFGGVGRHRLKLYSVDVYDVHQGVWSEAAEIPEAFTEVPPSCVMDDKFVYYKSATYIYDPNINMWYTFDLIKSSYLSGIIQPLLPTETVNGEMAIVSNDNENSDPPCMMALCWDPLKPHRESLFLNRPWQPRCWRAEWHFQDDSNMIYQQIWSDPLLVSFGYKNYKPYVEVRRSLYKISPEIVVPEVSEHWLDETNKPRDCFNSRLGCFKVIDPDTLYQSIYSLIFELCSIMQAN